MDGVADVFDRIEGFCGGGPAADDRLLLVLGFLSGDAPASDGVRSIPAGR